MTTPEETRAWPRDAARERMQDRRAAWLVAVPALLSIAAVLHHPVVHVAPHATRAELADAIGGIAATNALFHALILVVLVVQSVGLWSVAERLGVDRPSVRAGAILYAAGLAMLFAAATVDGFVTPTLVPRCAGDDVSCGAAFAASLAVERAWIQAFTKVGLGAQALALAAWAIALVGRPRATLRAVGATGVVLALVPVAMMATTDAAIGPSRLAALLAAECAWCVGAAILLWRGDLSKAASVDAGRTIDDQP